MRTTVDLPIGVHRRALALAQARGVSLSAVVSDLTLRGLAQLDQPIELASEPSTGLPVLSIGRKVTSEEVARLLEEE